MLEERGVTAADSFAIVLSLILLILLLLLLAID